MESLIVIVHVLAAIGITGLVLLQHGKGADMGASFGSGASQTVFGSMGSGNALSRSTTWLAVIFFCTSLALALVARQQAGQSIQDSSLIENFEQLGSLSSSEVPAQTDIPVTSAAGNADMDSDMPALEAAMDSLVEKVESAAANLPQETVETDAAMQQNADPAAEQQ